MPKARYNRKEGDAVCIVTGYPLDCKQGRIRLVVDPDQNIVPDINQELDASSSLWVTCNERILTEAVEKHILSHYNGEVSLDPLLPERIERLLRKKSLHMLSMAKKAGQIVNGYEKVKTLLQENNTKLLIQAQDGSRDNKEKLQLIARDTTIIDIFTGEELGLALGRCNIVHVAVRKGNLAEKLLDEVMRLYSYYDRSISIDKA